MLIRFYAFYTKCNNYETTSISAMSSSIEDSSIIIQLSLDSVLSQLSTITVSVLQRSTHFVKSFLVSKIGFVT